MSNSNSHFIEEPDAVDILRQYGIPYPVHRFARTVAEAIQGAEEMGYPVVLKIVSPQVIHKSDAGGVALGLKNAEELGLGFADMMGRVKEIIPECEVSGALVCRQADPGIEVIVGALKDPIFGPALMFGLGGIFTEVLKDVSFRTIPAERIDVEEMIREIKGYPILAGLRGQKPRDLEALADLLLAVSRLVSERPNIEELDLNPVRLYEQGLLVLDARILGELN
jgi:acyl-CoA synthetase (NDP forming)